MKSKNETANSRLLSHVQWLEETKANFERIATANEDANKAESARRQAKIIGKEIERIRKQIGET